MNFTLQDNSTILLYYPPPMAETLSEQFPLEDADRCVMCGLCLPHCPTYRLYNQESESPRGRIALMRAVARGEIPMTARLMTHLDHCLTCRACEIACPAEVPYGKLIDAARAMAKQKGETSRSALTRETPLKEIHRLERWRPLLRFYQQSGLQKAARALGLPKALGVKRQEQLLPALPPRHIWHKDYPAIGKKRGQVALFTGCTGKILDEATLQAAITVLTHLGYSVTLPEKQTCCGALHLREGLPQEARRLALSNIEAFRAERLDAIIYVTSGCGIRLIETPSLPELKDKERSLAECFSAKVREISQFISGIPWPAKLRLKPLDETAAVHTPCSLQHRRQQPETVFTLLGRIPRLTVVSLPDSTQCCGAAGDYLLRHPGIADTLLMSKLDALSSLQASLLVTSNIGCALHFQAGLRERKIPMEVVHPIVLIARQLALSP